MNLVQFYFSVNAIYNALGCISNIQMKFES